MRRKNVNPTENELFSGSPSNSCLAYEKVRAAKEGCVKEAREHREGVLSGGCLHGCRFWCLKEARQHCEDLWRDYAAYADLHFLDEFPLRFHQRWFEMYLTVSLLRAGLDVTCPKPGPDIRLDLHGRDVWIEAVCATSGQEGRADSVPNLPLGRAADVPMDQYVLRVSNSLDKKARKFEHYIQKGIVLEQDLVVIAININAVDGLWTYMDDFLKRALYGVGDPVLHVDSDTHSIVDTHHLEIESISKKSSGASVNVRPFVDGSMGQISSVWTFSGNAIDRPPKLGSDCIQYPNLTSANCWPQGTISMGEEWRFEESEKGWKGDRRSYP